MNIGVLSRPAEEFWKAHPELYRQLERLATPVQDPYASFYEELRCRPPHGLRRVAGFALRVAPRVLGLREP